MFVHSLVTAARHSRIRTGLILGAVATPGLACGGAFSTSGSDTIDGGANGSGSTEGSTSGSGALDGSASGRAVMDGGASSGAPCSGPVVDNKHDMSEQVCMTCGCATKTGTVGGVCPNNGIASKCTISVTGGGAMGGTRAGWHDPKDPHSCACDYSYTFCPENGYTFITVNTQYQLCP